MNKIFFVIALILLPLISICQTEWVEVGKIKDGTTAWVSDKYLSKEKLCKHTDVIRVWTRKMQPQMTVNGIKYKNVESRILYVVDLKTKQLTNINIVLYSTNGNVIGKEQREECEEKWTYAPPDTLLELILNKILELFGNN